MQTGYSSKTANALEFFCHGQVITLLYYLVDFELLSELEF